MTVKNICGIEMEYEAAENMMDDELREELAADMAPCSEQEFMTAYEEAHEKKFGETWELSKENPTW